MVVTYIKKDRALYKLCDSGVCSREKIYMHLVGQVSGLVENFNIRIFLVPINVISISQSVKERPSMFSSD